MFEERFMDFGAFPGDFNYNRRTSCTNRRFHDLGFDGSASNSVSNGFYSPDGPIPPFSPTIFNPFTYDQSPLHHLNLNINDEMIGNADVPGLCQNLSGMSISDEQRTVSSQKGPFRVNPVGFGSRTRDGFLGSNGNIRLNAETSHLYDGYCSASSGHGSSHNTTTSHGISLGSGGADDDRSRFLSLKHEFDLNGFDQMIARDRRHNLLEQRNASYEQSWFNTGYCFRDDSVIPQQCRLDLNMNMSMKTTDRSIQPNFGLYNNDLSTSPLTLPGNRAAQSFSPMEGSGNLGASGLDGSLIIQGSKFESTSKAINFKNDINTTDQGRLLLSMASMVEIYGSVHLMAKDQNGCRFLQKIFEKGGSIEVTIIFNAVIAHVIELAMDSFGNYFVQKLLEVCSEEQRMQIVRMMISKPGQLIKISLNTYGTRVVQKLIETLGTKQQIALMKSALKPGFLSLVRDLNGNHVIQRCLQSLGPDDNKFVFEAATKFCVEIATHRHGCCVLQRCISYAVGLLHDKLIAEISRNSLLLAQDPFGNYVVQYIIEQNVPSGNVLHQFKGHYVQLSTQKFSSHVVEKCLRHYPESRSHIVHELISSPYFEQLLQDPFANYVIQSALAFTKGNVRSCLVKKVRAYDNLRTSPYCKRIFSRNLLKK